MSNFILVALYRRMTQKEKENPFCPKNQYADMTTARNMQRGLFAESLRRQMDIMSKALKKDELAEDAQAYLSEGMTPAETVELLTMDGYDTTMAKSCVAMLTDATVKTAKSVPEWGFEVEDSQGRVFSNYDLDIVITAKDEASALKKAEEAIKGEENNTLDKVNKVYRLD
jgi:hypothetical protein